MDLFCGGGGVAFGCVVDLIIGCVVIMSGIML